jgi:hypothetical protein
MAMGRFWAFVRFPGDSRADAGWLMKRFAPTLR